MANYVGSKDVMISVPSVSGVVVSWNWKTIATELTFDDIGNDSFCIEATKRPFELLVCGVTIILALVPVTNRDGDCVWIAE